MSADASRLFWSCVIAWIVGGSAPRVAAGDTWGNAIAHNITAGLVGVILVICLFGIVACLHSLYGWIKGRYHKDQMQME
jgi:hypothetical protein